MKICLRNFWVVLAVALEAANYSSPLPSASAPASYNSPLPGAQLVLGNIAIGASVLDAVKRFGPPDVVRTTDLGHEWQWVDETGLDREVLANDDMVVRQVLVAEPAPIAGQPPPLRQPMEFKVLGVLVDDAAGAIAAVGGNPIVEPDPTVRAWDLPGGVLVAELDNGVVARMLALDDTAARLLGYLQPPPPARMPAAYRAPVLTQDYYVPYPADALRGNVEGTAVVRVLIDPKGAPKDLSIVVASGNSAIDAAALESVRKSTFRPARCDGVPCAGVYFDLQDFSIFK
jgi:TonB family protein